jgi:hypothetical protein
MFINSRGLKTMRKKLLIKFLNLVLMEKEENVG